MRAPISVGSGPLPAGGGPLPVRPAAADPAAPAGRGGGRRRAAVHGCRITRRTLLWLPGAIALAACRRTPFDVARVGAVAPLAGERAAEGREVVDAVRLAVEEWNGAGGVYGLHLELTVLDEHPPTARRLVLDRRVALAIGYLDLTAAAAAREALSEPDAPAAVLLVNPDPRPAPQPAGVVVLAPARAQVAEVAAAAVAYNFGPVTVAVVASGNADDVAAARAFVAVAPTRGLRVVADLTLAAVETNYARVAGLLRAAAPSVIYVAGRGLDAGALWAEVRPRDSRARLVLGPGALDEGFYRTGRGFLDGVYALETAARPADLPAAAAFVAAFTGRYGRPPAALAARAYDAATLGLRALASVSHDGMPARAAVRAALPAGGGFTGVLRTYPLLAGTPTGWKLALYRLDRDGALTLVGEPEIR
jgi:branched-chain amino acid transport system substrate-binding protein